jgi:hypothetical protein
MCGLKGMKGSLEFVSTTQVRLLILYTVSYRLGFQTFARMFSSVTYIFIYLGWLFNDAVCIEIIYSVEDWIINQCGRIGGIKIDKGNPSTRI